MPPEVRCVMGDDDQVANARFDRGITSRAYVGLHRLVRLDRVDDLVIEARKILWESLRGGLQIGRHGSEGKAL